jgi:2-phospho-L-lactate guanylyltransferase
VENLAILVPLKGFAAGKTRLRDAGVAGVEDLMRDLARGVFAASRPRPLFVACESPDVVEFATEHGAQVISSPQPGLNEALTHAYQNLSSNFARIVIAHADLRDPAGLGDFDPAPGVTVVSDVHGTGTNVLALPSGLDFTFFFGPHSARAHLEEAKRLGLTARMIVDSPWRHDVDEPEDMVE